MSRAYCLSCNELLDVTPSGTCPVGHPVGGDIQSPEPWVGFAAARGNGERAQMNGHASPALDVTALQEAPPRIPAVETFREPAAAPLTQDDDLARLLAEALEESDPVAPGPRGPAEDTSASWDDLATLAAELKFDAEPVADWEPPAVPDVTTEPDVAPDAEVAPEVAAAPEPEVAAAPEPVPPSDVMDLGALEEVLAAFEDPAPARSVTEPVVDLPPPAFEAPSPPAVELPPPAPPVADLPPPVADLPPPVADLPPPVVPPVAPEPVGSEPLTAELPDDLDPEAIWADLEEPAPPPAAAPRIDPTNFTAKGSRIGDGQPRKRRWKR